MIFTAKTFNQIRTLDFTPEITAWYARIPDIIQFIYGKNTYHNFQPMVNELFQKDDFTVSFLNPEELDQLNHFKALKKQMEWSCGRYLLKRLLNHTFLQNCPLNNITISYQELGAPLVENDKSIQISLSHSNDYTVAACTRKTGINMGIDIEKIGPMPDSAFLKTAFTQNEITHLTDDPARVFKNWTLKEAFLKYIKKGFNESLKHVEVINDQIFHRKKAANLRTDSRFFDGYVVSLVSDSCEI